MTPRTRPTPDADGKTGSIPLTDGTPGPELDLGAALDARVAQDYAAAALTEEERAEAVTLYVVIAPHVFIRMRAVKGPSGTAWRNRPYQAGAILPAEADPDDVARLVKAGMLRAVHIDPTTGEVHT